MTEPLKVGDLIASVSRYEPYNGHLFKIMKIVNDVVKYMPIWQKDNGMYFSQLNLMDEGRTWKRYALEPSKHPRIKQKRKPKCVCHSQDLFNFGCKCGGL